MCSNSAFYPLTLLQFAIITSSSSLRVWCGVLQLLGWLPTGDGVGSTDLGGSGYRGWCCWGQLAVGREGRGHTDFLSSSIGVMACGARCIVSRVKRVSGSSRTEQWRTQIPKLGHSTLTADPGQGFIFHMILVQVVQHYWWRSSQRRTITFETVVKLEAGCCWLK